MEKQGKGGFMSVKNVDDEIKVCKKTRGKAYLTCFLVNYETSTGIIKELCFTDKNKALAKIERLKAEINFNKKRESQKQFKENNYNSWTPSAIECYERQCECYGCSYSRLESGCEMKTSVLTLKKRFGIPKIDNELAQITTW